MLSKKERQILTYFEHGVRKNNIIKELNEFFGYKSEEIKQIFEDLRKKKLIEELEVTPKTQLFIISTKVTKDMLDDEVKYILEQLSKFKTFKDFLRQRAHKND